MLLAVIAFALVFGCVVYVSRIRQTQKRYEQLAVKYADMEKRARKNEGFFLRFAQQEQREIEEIESRPSYQFLRSCDNLSEIQKFILNSYKDQIINMAGIRKKALSQASESGKKAQRFAQLKRAYQYASRYPWASVRGEAKDESEGGRKGVGYQETERIADPFD